MGFFDAPQNTQVDTSGAFNLANQYNEQAQDFFDPNSSFYQQAGRGQQQNLLDIFAIKNREKKKQLASQGINSNSLIGALYEDSSREAVDQSNRFQSDVYRQGLGTGAQLAGIGQGYHGQGMAGETQNAQANAQWQNSLLNLGGSVTGAVAGGPGKSFLNSLMQGGSSDILKTFSNNFQPLNSNYSGSSAGMFGGF